jgi:hypothetical protein
VGFLRGTCNRFFTHNMLAGFHHLNAHFGMGIGRGRDNDNIDLLSG